MYLINNLFANKNKENINSTRTAEVFHYADIPYSKLIQPYCIISTYHLPTLDVSQSGGSQVSAECCTHYSTNSLRILKVIFPTSFTHKVKKNFFTYVTLNIPRTYCWNLLFGWFLILIIPPYSKRNLRRNASLECDVSVFLPVSLVNIEQRSNTLY